MRVCVALYLAIHSQRCIPGMPLHVTCVQDLAKKMLGANYLGPAFPCKIEVTKQTKDVATAAARGARAASLLKTIPDTQGSGKNRTNP